MLKVNNIIKDFNSFFQEEIIREVRCHFKYSGYDVFSSAQFEKKNIIFNVSSKIDFGKTLLLAFASNVDPYNITIYSNNRLSEKYTKLKFSENNLCPLQISSSIHWSPCNISVCHKSFLVFKYFPRIIYNPFFDIGTSTRFSYHESFLRIDNSRHLTRFSLEYIRNNQIDKIFGINIIFDLTKKSYFRINAVSRQYFDRLCFSYLLSYPKTLAMLSLKYSTPNKNKFGVLVGTKKENDIFKFVGKIASSFDTNDNSTLHFVVDANNMASACYEIQYSKMLTMKFSASHSFDNWKPNLDRFGFVISFDY